MYVAFDIAAELRKVSVYCPLLIFVAKVKLEAGCLRNVNNGTCVSAETLSCSSC